MRGITLTTLSLTLLLAGASACGGGSDSKTIDTGDGGKVTVSRDLPGDFPDDFPVYDGADLQGASEGEQDGVKGIIATWTTGDDLDDVTAFYEDEFDGGPWTVTTTGNAGGSAYWAVEHSDSDQVGYVAVSPGDDVSIIATVGDDPNSASSDGGSDGDDSDDGDDDEVVGDGSGDGDGSDSGSDGSADASLPDEVDLPDGFPTDIVSLPGDAHVSTANTVTSDGVEFFTVAFYSRESVDELTDFYQDSLEGKGYTQSVQTSDASGAYAAYAENDDGTGAVIVLTVGEGDVEGYRQVVLQVNQS